MVRKINTKDSSFDTSHITYDLYRDALTHDEDTVYALAYGVKDGVLRSVDDISRRTGLLPSEVSPIIKASMDKLKAARANTSVVGTMYPAVKGLEPGPDGKLRLPDPEAEAARQAVINEAKADLEAVWKADFPDRKPEDMYKVTRWEQPKPIPGEDYLG